MLPIHLTADWWSKGNTVVCTWHWRSHLTSRVICHSAGLAVVGTMDLPSRHYLEASQ